MAMGVPIAIVDFSWLLYRSRFHHRDTCRFDTDGQMIPTGHVYGTINIIQQLSSQYKSVILAVDSHAPHRYKSLPTYKSDRHVPTGNPYNDYKVMTDLMNILKICTYQTNVFYIKEKGMESDDIIASWIYETNLFDKWDLYCYFNDVDILQTKGNYHWFRSFHEPEVDRVTYLRGKFGLEMDYLPVWWKVIRGDSSDGIPSGLPRFPSKKLVSICSSIVGRTNWDVEGFLCQLGDAVLTDVIKENIRRNHDVIRPKISATSDFTLKRLGSSLEEVGDLLSYYQINDFVVEG